MKTFSIFTRGCKVNQYETQQIRQLLECHGLTQAGATDAVESISPDGARMVVRAETPLEEYADYARGIMRIEEEFPEPQKPRAQS